jgi:peptide/nickel transport system substrate-binding protein
MDIKDLGKVHGAIPRLARDLEEGRLDRREFLHTTVLLGLSIPAAYGVVKALTGEDLMPRALAQEPRKGGNLRIGMSVMDSSDPAVYDWSEKGNVARLLVEQLVAVGTDNLARPHLAERWEASEDVKTWTFYLRQGVTWSNGDTFNADDVIATFTRWLDSKTGSSNQGRFIGLTVKDGDSVTIAPNALERIDDYTVRFNLQSAMLQFPESLGDYPALITHRDFATKFEANLMKHPVGTGPFALESFTVGERAVFKRREGYWGGDALLDGVEYIDLGADPSAQLAALASGQVDLLYTLDQTLIPALEQVQGITLYEKVTAIVGVARLRVVEKPFDNKQVRQAIRACIDHQRLLDLAYQGYGVPGEDFHVSPIHPEYTPLPPPVADIGKAKALLAEAGYPNGLDIEINCVNDPGWESQIAVVISEMVKPAGINLKVNVLPGGTYWDRWTSWPFSVTQWTTRPLGVQVLALAYRSGVAWNETGYANPEFDRILDEAQATIDLGKRQALVAQLEQIMQDDAIAIIPFWCKIFTASTDKVQGFEYHFAREMYLDKVWLSA